MSWSEGRSRGICKRITFTKNEWEQVVKLQKRLTEGLPKYRRFSTYARDMLTKGAINITVVKPLTDPDPIAAAIGRVGVNVNQIAHWANQNERIEAEQVDEVKASLERVEGLLRKLFDDYLDATEKRDEQGK